MPTTYTSLLGLALPATGELAGTWGTTVNDQITSLLDSAIAGTTTINTDADITLTTTTGGANQSRQAIILWTANGTVTRNITAPAASKTYVVINASAGTQSIVIRGVGPTAGVTVLKGERVVVAWNGSDFVKVSSFGGAGTFTDLTVTGNTILGDAAGDTITVNGATTFTNAAPILTPLTASRAVFTDGSKALVSNAITGTGNVVMSASPTLTGTVGAASLTLSSLTSGRVTYAGAGGALTDSANLTFNGTTLTAAGLAGPLNGSVGATTPSTGSFTTLSASSTVSGAGFSTYLASPPAIGGTAPAAGSFTTLSASSTVSGTGFSTYLASPPAIGGTAPAAGSFTTLSASSTVSGTGFTNLFASPPAIGSTAANTGAFTSLSASSSVTLSAGTANQVQYLNASKVLTGSANLTFDGTTLTANALSLTSPLTTANGGTGLSSYTAGDLTYYASGTALTKLGIGAANQILTSSGTAPQWTSGSSVSVGTATNLAGGTTGAVPYQTGAGATTFLSLGTSGQVLTAGASAPQYVNQSSLSVGSATNATNTGVTANSTNATNFLTFVSATSGNLPQLVNSSITCNPSTGSITGGVAGGAF